MKVLIANRGEISCRGQKACAVLGLQCVAVFTESDALSLHVLNAGESVCLGESPKDYLNADRLIQVAKETSCDAIFPGYGFLSENADFAETCEAIGIAFLGPTGTTMRSFSQKHTARSLAEKAGVPVLPGTGLLSDADEAVEAARQIGLPVLLKATGGGGGIGIHICRTEDDVVDKFNSAKRQGAAAFGDSGVFLEKFVEHARHIEVQIFGDGLGGVVTFPERECSIQRRHQKVLEETPSPFVSMRPDIRASLQASAKALASSVKYRSAGTVEFILDDDTGKFFFLEVNTRLQVEHGITEMVAGVDLVAWQLQLQGAAKPLNGNPGLLLPENLADFTPTLSGHAIEVRVCAEDPTHDYRPCTGILGEVAWPFEHARVDTWVETGSEVSAFYDSLLAKIMVHCLDGRQGAIKKMTDALGCTRLGGVVTNIDLLRNIISAPKFIEGSTTTKFLEKFGLQTAAVEVVEPGLMTTVQDYPGRTKLWSVGVPPSGPMDDLSHRIANALVGNDDNLAALEISLTGPTLKFFSSRHVAVCGAKCSVLLDGREMPQWESFVIKAGQILKVDKIEIGARAYAAVSGGIDVPIFLDSRSTFPGGSLGGHQGRCLRSGDMLSLNPMSNGPASTAKVPSSWRLQFPSVGKTWNVGVLPGPQADPDYFTEEDIAVFYSTDYNVHHNSNRLGIRLEGPRPTFARPDGGEGGSHPSNVHDHVYAIGTVNFTGDMPVVLMVDGPSLGGFVCPATVLSSELWKLGQVKAGDSVRFVKMSIEDALSQRMKNDYMIELLRATGKGELSMDEAMAQFQKYEPELPSCPKTAAVLKTIPSSESHPGAQIRLAGDRYVFVEYGRMELDLNLRVRVKRLQEWLSQSCETGILETSPGVRSVMVEYDQHILSLARLLDIIVQADKELESIDSLKLSTRIVHLPLAFNDRWTNDAIKRYSKSVRSEAPYLPSNVEFIARNNGIDGNNPIQAVRDIVCSASYMVLGLGDVYLGAPCAVPVDPRHRLVVPKYNPARTYTPEGGVGIGGCYMCIYPMPSPGGYQLVGRTLPIWNSYTRAGPFEKGKPWLLRNFDQIRYFLVSEEELEQMRKDFVNGRYKINIEQEIFDMAKYNEFLKAVQPEVDKMRARQRVAMEEMMRIDAEHLARIDSMKSMGNSNSSMMSIDTEEDVYTDQNGVPIRAAVSGTVWEVRAKVGDVVTPGDTIMVLEAMKMEYEVTSSIPGRIADIAVSSGDMVQQGAALCLLFS